MYWFSSSYRENGWGSDGILWYCGGCGKYDIASSSGHQKTDSYEHDSEIYPPRSSVSHIMIIILFFYFPGNFTYCIFDFLLILWYILIMQKHRYSETTDHPEVALYKVCGGKEYDIKVAPLIQKCRDITARIQS